MKKYLIIILACLLFSESTFCRFKINLKHNIPYKSNDTKKEFGFKVESVDFAVYYDGRSIDSKFFKPINGNESVLARNLLRERIKKIELEAYGPRKNVLGGLVKKQPVKKYTWENKFFLDERWVEQFNIDFDYTKNNINKLNIKITGRTGVLFDEKVKVTKIEKYSLS